jgi:hypothetical protein
MLDRKTNRKPKVPMVIDKKLPVGLTLVIGKAKIGKGWLVLQESHRLIKEGRTVLYYGLEEEDTLIDERIIDILQWDDEALRGFVLQSELGVLGPATYKKLEQQIETTGATVAVIDTYYLVHPPTVKMSNYTGIAGILKPLSEIGKRNACAVIVTIHMTKRYTGDLVTDTMGSAAMAGSADAIWGLYEEPDYCVWKITGKSAQAKDMALRLNEETARWEILGEVGKMKTTVTTETMRRVMTALDELQGKGKSAEIARQAQHMDPSQCNRALKALVEKGKVHQPESGGRYYITKESTTVNAVNPVNGVNPVNVNQWIALTP